MKELSVEEKAKRYDEALKVLHKYDGANIMFSQSLKEEMFPELAESEDERIKVLIGEALCDSKLSSEEVQDVLAWLEAQGEQKPVDKVEPKFKVGEWVVVDDGRTGRIIECTKDYADVDLEFSCLSTRVNNIRSWTIQDAKDGDVLYLQKDGKEHIIIYKGVIKERFKTFVSAYCAYNGIVDAFCFADVSRYVDIAYEGIRPATKEQRDLLFQKMADAGYTFDFEKKELKKIEQKPAWNEEDECTLLDTIRLLCSCGKCSTDRKLWLLSLKDRVQPLTKQEWSEEDERLRKSCIAHIEDELERIRNDKYGHSEIISDLKESCRERINWLESLRSRNHWKPSEEQMDALEKECIAHSNYELCRLLEQLKKL